MDVYVVYIYMLKLRANKLYSASVCRKNGDLSQTCDIGMYVETKFGVNHDLPVESSGSRPIGFTSPFD